MEDEPVDNLPESSEATALEFRKNKFARFSFICGIIGVCCLPALYSPLLAIIPILCIVGFFSGLIGMVIANRFGPSHQGLFHGLIGCVLCSITFGVTGNFYAALLNYAQQPICDSNQRQIAISLLMYTKDHSGHLPSSISAMARTMPYITPDISSSRKYYFYFFYTKSPFLLNGYLAGKKLDNIAHPERTLLTVEGKDIGTKLFFNWTDLDTNVHGSATFLDGHCQRFDQRELATHISSDGKNPTDSWFFKPIMLSPHAP